MGIFNHRGCGFWPPGLAPVVQRADNSIHWINLYPVDGELCFVIIFELFCLQNSLIVGMQPQVSRKVGSLVGFWVDTCSVFPMTVEFYRKASCRGRNKNANENSQRIPLLKRHDESLLVSFA